MNNRQRELLDAIATVMREHVDAYNQGEDVTPITAVYMLSDAVEAECKVYGEDFDRAAFLAACGIESAEKV